MFDNIGKSISRDKGILQIGLFLLFVAWFYVFIVEPFSQERNNLNQQLASTKARLIRYNQLLQEEETIRKTYAQFFSSPERRTDADLSTFALKELQEIANKCSVKILELQQSKTAIALSSGMDMELRAEATEDNFAAFIYFLRTSGPLFYIKKFNLQLKEGGKLEARFLISYLSGL